MKIRKAPRPAAPPVKEAKAPAAASRAATRPGPKPLSTPSQATGHTPHAPQTQRLFFALKVPGDVATPLAGSQRQLRGNWRAVRADQLHITLAYLPAVPPDRVADLKRLGARLTEQLSPMHIRLRGTGYFPNEGSPRVWFVKAEAEGLNELAAELRVGLRELGIATDDLPFKAHVTLARKKGPAPRVPPLLFDLGWQAGNLALIRSTLRKTGPIYDTVSTFRLRGEASNPPPAATQDIQDPMPSAPFPSQETP
ncbi:RNA 2',3'-cyclic phosphodiesterase [Deinococcus sp. MIMF12]|uniref:RNA 2',3'-cyclic phosphodiesterase n=1 Tax=Deinococcus rhizophilus TaxID=3049544 RepID=A0ABT7JL39_9DEIO|nr:RNA 2',3'-cyclic phosphodiesterase [Deinococcus rhizophilus]MDL2345183.1 RNA 2',3'-cyclic phosphodiesterase [Deinococcus rhizophilus]